MEIGQNLSETIVAIIVIVGLLIISHKNLS
mgnify:CR=1 FL=1